MERVVGGRGGEVGAGRNEEGMGSGRVGGGSEWGLEGMGRERGRSVEQCPRTGTINTGNVGSNYFCCCIIIPLRR